MFASGINAAALDQVILPTNFYTHGLKGHFEPWKAVDTLAILKLRHYEMSRPAIDDKLLRFDLLNSPLYSSWVIDQFAPKHQSKNKDRAFSLLDSSTGDNLQELPMTFVHELHEGLLGPDVDLSVWPSHYPEQVPSHEVYQE